MPYRLRKAPNRNAYWVVDDTGKHYSKDPLPKDRAKAQQRALYASERMKGGLRLGDVFGPKPILEGIRKMTGRGTKRGGNGEREYQKLYDRLRGEDGLSEALARKLVGMAKDLIDREGRASFDAEFPPTNEGHLKFIGEAVSVLVDDPSTRSIVMADPIARRFTRREPKPTQSAAALPAPQSGRPNLPAPPSRPPSPARPKKEKKKPKAKPVDPDMALLDAEIARNRAEEEEQVRAQAEELARLRERAAAGDEEAREMLERYYEMASGANAGRKKRGKGNGPVMAASPPPPPPPNDRKSDTFHQAEGPKPPRSEKEIAASLALARSMGLSEAEARERLGLPSRLFLAEFLDEADPVDAIADENEMSRREREELRRADMEGDGLSMDALQAVAEMIVSRRATGRGVGLALRTKRAKDIVGGRLCGCGPYFGEGE